MKGDPTKDIPLNENMEFIEVCPACHGVDIPITVVVYEADAPVLFCSVCEDCGQNFLNPRFTDEYTKTYYQGLYRNVGAGGLSSGEMRLQFLRAHLQKDVIKETVPAGTSALEIGSSLGCMLNELEKLDYTCLVGVEPDERYHKYFPANKFTCYTDISEVPKQPFDLIVMSHSLEHLNQPLDFMRSVIENYTHPDTHFFIEVPNIAYEEPLYMPHHPINFDQKTLNGLFERLGCEAVYNSWLTMNDIPGQPFVVGVYKRSG